MLFQSKKATRLTWMFSVVALTGVTACFCDPATVSDAGGAKDVLTQVDAGGSDTFVVDGAALPDTLPVDAANTDTTPFDAGRFDSGPMQVVINEVVASGEPLDWVEFFNPSATPADLTGYFITDDINTQPQRTELPPATVVPASGYLVLELDSFDFPGFALGSHEQFGLVAADGTVVDFVNWDEGESPLGASYGRIPNGAGNFKTLFTPTEGAANVDNGGGADCGSGAIEGDEGCDDGNQLTGDGCSAVCQIEIGWSCDETPSVCHPICGDYRVLGREQCDQGDTDPGDGCDENCRFETVGGAVAINELVAKNSDPDGSDWLEILNTGESEVSLDGWYFTDNNPGQNRFDFPAATSIAAGEFLVIRRNAVATELSFPFNLSSNDEVRLHNPSDELVDVASWIGGDAPEGTSWGRLPDGDGDFRTLLVPTPGAPNYQGPTSCAPEVAPVIPPIWQAGGSGGRQELGTFGKPDAIFLDDNGILLAGDEDGNYEELHLFDITTDDPLVDGDFISPVVDLGADPGPGGDGQLEFRGISGFAQDPVSKKIYVVEQGNGRIQVLRRAATPTPTHIYEWDAFWGGFAVDRDNPEDGEFCRLQAARTDLLGRLFVSDDAKRNASTARRDIQVFDNQGSFLFKFGDASYGPLGQQGNLQEPENFVIDQLRDRIYVCDEGPRNIAVYRYSDQTFVQRLGGFTGTPNGVDIDQFGYLYAVDEGNANGSFVRIFDPDSLTEVFHFGDYSEAADLTLGKFNSPDTLIINIEQNLLLVADQGHDRIQAFRLSDIQRRACLRALRLRGPQTAMAGKRVVLSAELLGPDELLDWASFRQTGTLTATGASGGSLHLDNATMVLHNGMGTVAFSVPTADTWTVTLKVSGLQATHSVEVRDDLSIRSLSGTLTDTDLTWAPGDGVIHLTADTLVPAGSTLVVHPGTLVMLANTVRLDVQGNLQAIGEYTDPISIFAEDAATGWGQIEHYDTGASAVYRSVFLSGGGNTQRRHGDGYHNHCCTPMVRTGGISAEFSRVVFSHAQAKGLLTVDSTVLVKDSLFSHLGMGAEFVHGEAVLEQCRFTEFRGLDDNDGLYFWAKNAPGDHRLNRVVIADLDDDALDTSAATPVANGLIIYGAADKGLALTGGSFVCNNCLIADTRVGVRSNDQYLRGIVVAELNQTTLVDNREIGFHSDNWVDGSDIQPKISRTVMWHNPQSIVAEFAANTFTINDSNLEHPLSGAQGAGNISETPIFLDPERYDYRLHPLSPGWSEQPMGWRGF